ncbi:hypothetical protein RUM44_010476 [Polyplax serrata]|uniref:Uncharacterized protein n=1 Tax=Polyplax serrata TaxID=468196 RepID=A0ABR1AVM3_POLSC
MSDPIWRFGRESKTRAEDEKKYQGKRNHKKNQSKVVVVEDIRNIGGRYDTPEEGSQENKNDVVVATIRVDYFVVDHLSTLLGELSDPHHNL